MLGAGALGRPRGMVWGGRREEGSGWGTHVYLWRIHFDIWQNKYNYVKFKNKIKLEKKKKKIARKNINNLRNADDNTLMAESEEELKSLLMRVKEESENAGLKLNIQKTRLMASSPITSWQIDGETIETVTDFIFLGSKITVDSDCSHEIKRHLLLGRKSMTNLLKSWDTILPTKVRIVKPTAFPAGMYRCES